MNLFHYPLNPRDVFFRVRGKETVSKFLNNTLPSWLENYEFTDENGLLIAVSDRHTRYRLAEGHLKIGHRRNKSFNIDPFQQLCKSVGISLVHEEYEGSIPDFEKLEIFKKQDQR
jgi:hypothetical protein